MAAIDHCEGIILDHRYPGSARSNAVLEEIGIVEYGLPSVVFFFFQLMQMFELFCIEII